jgi:transposase InsO family protein
VEFATLQWVAWYNGRRLLEPLGYVPLAEFEQAYQDRQGALLVQGRPPRRQRPSPR